MPRSWRTQLSGSSGYLTAVAGPVVLFGLGGGLLFMPLSAVLLSGVRLEDSGAASGAMQTAQQLGEGVRGRHGVRAHHPVRDRHRRAATAASRGERAMSDGTQRFWDRVYGRRAPSRHPQPHPYVVASS